MDSIRELYAIIEKSPEGSLFVFDVDHVLTMPRDPYFHILTAARHESFIDSLFVAEEELHLFYALAMMQGDQIFVEDATPDVLRAIAAKGFRTMALTAIHVAEIDGVMTTDWRLEQLRHLGVDFKDAFPKTEPFVLDVFDNHCGGRPTYQDGVLFSHIVQDKGTVLKTFLNIVEQRPSSIIFVDDVKENVKAVEKMAAEEGIPCQALHYRGAYLTETPHVDAEIARANWQKLAAKAREIAAELAGVPT